MLCKRLLLRGCSNGANACAGSAAYANISVDLILAVAFGNSSNGALSSASAAADAGFGNYKCHSFFSFI